MKHTIFLTQRCNLACRYCYIQKQEKTLSLDKADEIIQFIFKHTPAGEKVDIGFFGGEPLLEFDLLKKITEKIIRHSSYRENNVILNVVSNGTLFSDDIAAFLKEQSIGLGISCDGLPAVQNKTRPFKNGKGSSQIVEQNILKALRWFPLMPVNAVYSADTLPFLPETVDYLSGLGIRNIYLNQDISSKWTERDAGLLADIYTQIARKYLVFYLQGKPQYISLIDSKIAVVLRGGYKTKEKCSMGKGELAYATSGNIYPCERLVEGDVGGIHCLGNVKNDTVLPVKCAAGAVGIVQNTECQKCSLREYCMNWCGCTNYFATGSYNRVNHFICASEKAAIQAALMVIEEAGKNGISFSEHLAGTPLMSIMNGAIKPS